MLEEIGVEAVVEGLSTFIGNMGSIKSAIEGISPSATILGQVFEGLGNIAGNVASFISDVLANAIGFILRDAIEGTIAVIGSLISGMVEAGNQFQALSIRLQGINLATPVHGFQLFTGAVERAQAATQSEIKWIQQMAIITPFSAAGIGSVYTMQRAMGLSDQAAKDLTVSITNWAAGMALPEEKVTLLSDALGKMTSSGKVNALAFRQLRAEYVGIPEVLEVMRKNLGLTTAQFDALEKSGKLAPADFIAAFEEVANTRFPDAAQKMAHTWEGAVNNIKDIFANIGGGDIVKPFLDVLGNFAGNLVDVFAVMTDHGPELTALGKSFETVATNIGLLVSSITTGILDFSISPTDLANGVLDGMVQIVVWLQTHKQEIIDGFHSMFDWVISIGNNPIVQGIIENLQKLKGELFGIQTPKEGPVAPNGPSAEQGPKPEQKTGIQELADAFGRLAKSIGDVAAALGIGGLNLPQGNNVQQLVTALNGLSTWIENNKVGLANLLKFFAALLIIQFVVALVVSLAAGFAALLASVGVFTIISVLILIVVGVVMFLVATFRTLWVAGLILGAILGGVIEYIILRFRHVYENATKTILKISDAFTKKDWGAIGTAIIEGITQGITSAVADLVTAATDAAQAAMDAIARIVKPGSPSETTTVFGKSISEGLAQGITEKMLLVANALGTALAPIGPMVLATLPLIAEAFSALGGIITSVVIEPLILMGNAFVVIVANVHLLMAAFNAVKPVITSMVTTIASQYLRLVTLSIQTVTKVKNAFIQQPWHEIGAHIIQGIANGVESAIGSLVAAVVHAAQAALAAAESVLGIHSPSIKFHAIGVNMIEGMANGIRESAEIAAKAMESAASTISLPAMSIMQQYTQAAPSSISNTYQRSDAYNLHIHTSAKSEPLVQDFRTLQSLSRV